MTNLLDKISTPIKNEFESFINLYNETLSSKGGLLDEVCQNILSHKGKMMRPILLLLIAKELGKVNKSSLLSAVTLEILHTASLLHDDVVDDSDERRGNPSINYIYGNSVAVLTGDFLLSESLSCAAKTGNIDIVNTVSNLGKQLSEGELIQLSNATIEKVLSEEEYIKVIKLKTAALFSACSKLGALSVGANGNKVKQMETLGELIGLCFQIRDDIFDYFDKSEVGKPTGNDMREGKFTLPIIFALNNTNNVQMISLVEKVKSGDANADEIKILCEFAKQNGGIEYAIKRMNDFANEAKKIIVGFTNNDIRTSLNLYIDYVINREK